MSEDRVVARPVDSALRCEACGERCTSGLALREHTIREHAAAGRVDTDDSGETCPACGDPMPESCAGPSGRHQPIPAARPAEPPGELREGIAQETAGHGLAIGVNKRLVLCTCGWRDESDDNLVRPLRNWALHIADALLSGPLASLLAAQATWRELLRQVVMDWVPKCDVPDCTCSAHRARRALDGTQ